LEPFRRRAPEDGPEGEYLPLPDLELPTRDREFEVEKVLAKKTIRGARQYLVQWRDYPEDYNSWQPEENLCNAPEKILEFEKREKEAKKDRRKGKGKQK
jgi:hypothetical protein